MYWSTKIPPSAYRHTGSRKELMQRYLVRTNKCRVLPYHLSPPIELSTNLPSKKVSETVKLSVFGSTNKSQHHQQEERKRSKSVSCVSSCVLIPLRDDDDDDEEEQECKNGDACHGQRYQSHCEHQRAARNGRVA